VDIGDSWLLKSFMEQDGKLSPALQAGLLENLSRVDAWAALLHMCQLIQYLDVSEAGLNKIMPWAEDLTEHKRPFVRAWALHVICVCADRVPRHRPYALSRIELADQDEKPSVQARMRNLRREFAWLKTETP